MAYTLHAQGIIYRNLSLFEGGGLSCYDTLDDPDFYYDRDFLLHYRSALEFVRDQLSASQLAELDAVDAHWRAHAALFNRAFGIQHGRGNHKNALQGFVQDEGGKAPEIPADHWWWQPLPEGGPDA